jgi:Phytanoyl-CoA dioxygenase (PhyH)
MKLGFFKRAPAFTPPELDDAQRGVLERMRSDGIAIVPFRDVFGDELWERLSADIAGFVAATEENLPELRTQKASKSYLVRRFGKAAKTFGLDDLWLQLGLSSRMLDIVNSYRGELTWFVDFDNWYTIPDSEAVTRVASQRWHRDPWDNHVVKVFTYFTDVDQEAGPFEYVRSSAEGGRYGDRWPWEDGGGDSVYPPQDEFENAIDSEDVMTITGPAGTTIFCDTSGFHRGGWARSEPRVLSYHAYVTSRTRKPPRLRVDWSTDSDGLSDAARYALSYTAKR